MKMKLLKQADFVGYEIHFNKEFFKSKKTWNQFPGYIFCRIFYMNFSFVNKLTRLRLFPKLSSKMYLFHAWAFDDIMTLFQGRIELSR